MLSTLKTVTSSDDLPFIAGSSSSDHFKFLAHLVEQTSDVLTAADINYKPLTWNKAAEKVYGLKAEQVIGRELKDLLDFNYHNTTREDVRRLINEEGEWRGEVSFTRPTDQKKITLLVTFKQLKEEEGVSGYLISATDITERKEAELFYRTLIADSLDGMILLDAEGKISFASPSVKNVLGYAVEDVLGKSGFEFVHPEDLAWASSSFQKEVIENPDVKFITVRLLKKNGHWVWCMVRGHNLLSNPHIGSIVVYFHDDTLRKEAKDALKESERKFRNLIHELPIGVIVQDNQGKTILCNDAFAGLFLRTKEELIGKSILDIVIDPIHENGTRYREEDRPTYKAIRTKEMAKDIVMGVYRPKRNDRVWIIVNADPFFDENDEIVQIIFTVKDITQRKRMEEEELYRQVSHQKQLTQATIDGQEKERREIGKELHDNIGQQLTTIKLFLDFAKTSADEATLEMVNMALKGVSDVINEVRAMSHSLVPHTLKDLGLVDSINELIESLKRTQSLEIQFQHKGFDESSLPENQKMSLFRIIQEQLNNVIKHAGGKKVSIKLYGKASEILLEIRDDGNGFDIKKIRRGLGFINICNRAELFNGKAEIHSRPGQGCHLMVSFPQSNDQAC